MIKINYWKDERLKRWYGDEMLTALRENIRMQKASAGKSADPILHHLEQEMLALKDETVRDILLENRTVLEKKYGWISEYLKVCDFTAYYGELRELSKKKRVYTSLRIEYLNRHRGYYLEELISRLSMKETVLTHSWKNFDRLWREAVRCCKELNRIIGRMLDYSMMPQQVRHQLYQKMDVQVCPYCNRQYIHTVTATEKEVYLGDLDHFYPKSVYPLFSLSLWNLIPVCKPCNQLFKRQYNRKILSPVEAGFGDDCILKIDYQDVASMAGMNDHFTFGWSIRENAPEDKKARIRQNLDLFCLNDVYQYHKQDIQNILRRRYFRSRMLARKQEELLGDFCLPQEDVNRLIYGASLNREQFCKELLGKMGYDVAMYG